MAEQALALSALRFHLLQLPPRRSIVDPPHIQNQGVDHLQAVRVTSDHCLAEPKRTDILHRADVPLHCTAHR